MLFYCKLCWVVEQLWSLKYERKSQFKGFLKKDVIPEEIKKEKRRSEKKRKKENTNDFKLTWKKCFYTWKLKQTQNKICHESQWSTRMIGHSVATPLCTDHPPGGQRTLSSQAEASRC